MGLPHTRRARGRRLPRRGECHNLLRAAPAAEPAAGAAVAAVAAVASAAAPAADAADGAAAAALPRHNANCAVGALQPRRRRYEAPQSDRQVGLR